MAHGHTDPWRYPWRTYELAVEMANKQARA